jgi:hypothetical protein
MYTKIVKSKKSDTVYICYPVPSWEHLVTRCELEGVDLPDPVPDTDSLD